MDRTVPKTGSEEIELYLRTIYSLLRSTRAVQLDALIETHIAMGSSLHVKARDPGVDASALFYAVMRLPPCIADVNLVVLGQTDRVFQDYGYKNVGEWEVVTASARRRRIAFDGGHTLAAFIASRSDIDDLLPMLVAYQIEWNKIHTLLQSVGAQAALAAYGADRTLARTTELARLLDITPDELSRLTEAWGPAMISTLQKMAAAPKSFSVRLLAGTYINYLRATSVWWFNVRQKARPVSVEDRPAYFVSSNVHAIPNLLSGFALSEEEAIFDYVRQANDPALTAEYDYARLRDELNNKNNFLYYALRRYASRPEIDARRLEMERARGIQRIPSEHGFDVEAQVIELSQLDPDAMDPRLLCCDKDEMRRLRDSDAVIINIDYPLGMAAYHVLAKVSEYVSQMQGVYVIGKAATLNARIGDVLLANVVYDEHSQNSYLFGNCFTASDILPYLTSSSVLDNQKGVSARGTFLQNVSYMDVFYREGYTIVEMEAGPYLSAIYEMVRAQRHPVNEIVNLYIAPFEVGFLHYASDTPLSKGRNLGAGRLSYLGAEPTYATAIATLRRIFAAELARLRERPSTAELRTENPSLSEEGADNGSLSGDSDQPVSASVHRSPGQP